MRCDLRAKERRSTNPPSRRAARFSGLTLIELLVVVAILAAVAGAATTLVDNLDRRSRYEETVARLGEVRAAVLGPDVIASNGDMLVGGYLQDVGWLPAAAADIVFQSPAGVAPRQYSATWRTWYGWGGPYLTSPALREADAAPTLYDDWGNEYAGWPAESFGAPTDTPWNPALLSGPFAVHSLGADGKQDDGSETDPLTKQYPNFAQPLIAESDWVTDLRTWQVRVINKSSTDFSALPVSVRLKVVVPRWDAAGGAEPPLDAWPATEAERAAWEHYGQLSFTLNLAINSEMSIQFGDNDPTHFRRVPHGQRMLFLVDNRTGQPVRTNAWSELKLSRRLSPPTEVILEIRD